MSAVTVGFMRGDADRSTFQGAYRMVGTSGTMAAGLAAAAPVFSFRWTSSTRIAVVRQVRLGVGSIAAFAAGFCSFGMIAARGFSVSDSGGTALTLTTNNGKLRTSYPTTLLGDARISATAALGVGSRTLDAQGFSALTGAVPAVAGNVVIPETLLFEADSPLDNPLILEQNEGFVIHATVPATGTWTFSVDVEWTEFLTSFV